MLLSILIKGVAAVVELTTQLFISNYMGVRNFGMYTFFVSIIECSYFMLLSGSIKINTFYLSTAKVTIKEFKRKYMLYYVFPIIFVALIISLALKQFYFAISFVVVFIYYISFDKSSIFFAKGKQLQALLGEYLVGRVMLLVCVVVCFKLGYLSTFILLCLIGIQYLSVYIWFILFELKLNKGTKKIKVSIHKLLEYQESDIASSLISYTPTFIQYLSGGAFATGFIGVISVVRKLINFISGPTAKVFLPEFSKLYKENKIDSLQKTYLMIVKVQMIFIGSVGVAVVGFPKLLLSIFNSKLVPYTSLFLLTGICLLFIASLGPVVGIMQMTGNERKGNINQWISILIMCLSWVVLYNNRYFVVYGLCIQAIAEGLLEYITICMWMKRFVVSPVQFFKLWFPIILISVFIRILHLSNSLVSLIISVVVVGCINIIIALNDTMVQNSFSNFLRKLKK